MANWNIVDAVTRSSRPRGNFLRFRCMDRETDKIHVISLADDWEIESQSGAPLAHSDDKRDAVDTAKQLAKEQGIETVILHHGDGVTEEVPVPSNEKPAAP